MWLEMAPHERQSPFHFLNTSDVKQIHITKQAGKPKNITQRKILSKFDHWFSRYGLNFAMSKIKFSRP